MSTPTTSGRQGRLLTLWAPEDKSFWEREGEAVAKLNLWISVPALFLAFAIWQVWSVVAVSLPGLGFKYSTNQLFWLAAAPALSGATLRIFYSFMVPLVGGRRWTAISTASLLIPALGIGFAGAPPPAHGGRFAAIVWPFPARNRCWRGIHSTRPSESRARRRFVAPALHQTPPKAAPAAIGRRVGAKGRGCAAASAATSR